MGSILIREERGKSIPGRGGKISKGKEMGPSLDCSGIVEHAVDRKAGNEAEKKFESGYESPGVSI